MCVFLLLCTELLFRFMYEPHDILDTRSPNFVHEISFDEQLGWSLISNLNAPMYHYDNKNIIQRIHNNGHMRLSRNITKLKPENTTRILILGDSMIYGVGIDQKDTLPYNLQDILDHDSLKSSRRAYEVLTLATPSYGTDQEYLSYYFQGVEFNPDIVILGMFYNDFYENMMDFTASRKPLFYLNYSTAGLMLANFPVKEFKKEKTRPKPHSALLNKITTLKQNKQSFYNQTNRNYWLMFEAINHEGHQQGYAVMHKLLFTIKHRVELNNATLIILYLPSQLELDTEIQQRFMNQYDDISATDLNFTKHHDMMFDIYTLLNISVIDFTDEMSSDPKKFFLKKDNHYSEIAQELIAQRTAEKIE